MGYLMGIDLGTSSVKALITDETGEVKGIGQVGYEILTPRVGMRSRIRQCGGIVRKKRWQRRCRNRGLLQKS